MTTGGGLILQPVKLRINIKCHKLLKFAQTKTQFQLLQRVPANKDLFQTIPKIDVKDKPAGEKFECECKKEMGLAYQECDVRHTGEQKGNQTR